MTSLFPQSGPLASPARHLRSAALLLVTMNVLSIWFHEEAKPYTWEWK